MPNQFVSNLWGQTALFLRGNIFDMALRTSQNPNESPKDEGRTIAGHAWFCMFPNFPIFSYCFFRFPQACVVLLFCSAFGRGLLPRLQVASIRSESRGSRVLRYGWAMLTKHRFSQQFYIMEHNLIEKDCRTLSDRFSCNCPLLAELAFLF